MDFLYGHRGASQTFPENTMQAFQSALASGANAIETDVRITADGEVVIFHDPTAKRIAGHDGRVEEHSLRDVQQWDVGWQFVDSNGGRPFADQGFVAPTLDQVLTELSGVRLNIDIKEGTQDGTRRVFDIVRSHKASQHVLLTSFHSRTRDQLLALGYEGPTGLGKRDSLALVFYPEFALKSRFRPNDRAQLPPTFGPLKLGTEKFIAKAHRVGLKVDFWTINDQATADALIGAGADGIMSDCPGDLAERLTPLIGM